MNALKEWKEFCQEKGISGDIVSGILTEWQFKTIGRAVDDLAELNQFLGLIARELGEEKWNELIDKFDQWKREDNV